MLQTLYKFGVDSSDPAAKAHTPVPVVTNQDIEILWSSWCDLIYTTLTHNFERTVTYLGTGLNDAQQLDLQSDLAGRRSPIAASQRLPHFFGTAMHDGVRGYIVSKKVTIYGTPGELADMGNSYRDVASWEIPQETCHMLAVVSMCGDGSLLVAGRPSLGTKSGCEVSGSRSAVVSAGKGNDMFYRQPRAKESRGSEVHLIRSLQSLQKYCSAETHVASVAQFTPTQLVANATTATALDENGRVHTRTTDPRYPACLGRLYSGTSTFESVPYLSELRIVKIASGGYMTAAISEDGELFLWGQANPGTEGELSVLQSLDYEIETANSRPTGIWAESGQDMDVKCLNIRIDGREATAYDVAVGFGHILVAAKNDTGQRVVFAAGCGEEGQLGLGNISYFSKEFEEVEALRGKRVTQIVAVGWSSFVVTG